MRIAVIGLGYVGLPLAYEFRTINLEKIKKPNSIIYDVKNFLGKKSDIKL